MTKPFTVWMNKEQKENLDKALDRFARTVKHKKTPNEKEYERAKNQEKGANNGQTNS